MKQAALPYFILHSALLMLFASTSCRRKEAEPPPPPPPPVDALVLDNLADEFPGEIRTADFAGQVQLLLFLRTDDPPCRASVPEWNALQAELAPRGFTLVGVVVDDRPAAQIATEAAELGISFPVGLAGEPVVRAVGGPAAVHAIPTAFLLGRDGTLLRTYPGFFPPDILRDDLLAALDGLPLPSLAVDEDETETGEKETESADAED